VIPVLCPGCRSPVPSDTVKCPWCGRNVNQGTWDDERADVDSPDERVPSCRA